MSRRAGTAAGVTRERRSSSCSTMETIYVVERVIYLSIYILFFLAFVSQNYRRMKRSDPRRRLFELQKTQAVNQLTGVLISFWSIACWTDINHVFYPQLAVFNEFSFAAAFSSLCIAFVLNSSIAVRVIGGGGMLQTSTQNLNYLQRTVRSTFQFGQPYGTWFIISVSLPWISAIIMAGLMKATGKAYAL